MRIDADDRERVNRYRWSLQGRYLRVNRHWNGKQHNIYLHHYLIGMSLDRTLEIDHINRDPLDNRKKNLRFVTRQENMWNRKEGLGVYWDRDRGNWVAQCKANGTTRYLGSHKTKRAARSVYLKYKTQIENKRR